MIFLITFLEYKMSFFSTLYFLNDEISNFFVCRFELATPPYTALPSSCGILGYNPKTSAVTQIASPGLVFILLIFSMKSPESLI